MRYRSSCSRIALILVLTASPLLASAAVTEWVTPRFATSEPENARVTEVKRYNYQEQLFSPALTVTAPVATTRFAEPWETFVSRISGMMQLDYAAWFSTWDAEARELVKARNVSQQQDADYWEQWWSDTFTYGRFQLVRKLTLDNYVLLTYRGIAADDGRVLSHNLEFPVVLKQSGNGQWLATLDLRAHPLPSLSPWVSGETRAEVTVR